MKGYQARPTDLASEETHTFLFFHLFWHVMCEVCSISAPWTRIEPMPLAVEARSPNHWTTREFPKQTFSDSDSLSCTLRAKARSVKVAASHDPSAKGWPQIGNDNATRGARHPDHEESVLCNLMTCSCSLRHARQKASCVIRPQEEMRKRPSWKRERKPLHKLPKFSCSGRTTAGPAKVEVSCG